MQTRFGEKGLTILGVTAEGTNETETWTAKHGMAFPWAYDRKRSLAGSLGVSGIPHAVLVDPVGDIVWRGHPATLKDDVVEAAVKGAMRPLWEWPAELSAAIKLLQRGDLGKALVAAAEAAGADEKLASFARELQALIDARIDRLVGMSDRGDFLGATEFAKRLEGELEGTDAREQVSELAAALRDNPNAKKIVKAQKLLAKIRGQSIRKKDDAERVLRQLTELRNELPGTYVAQQAEEYSEAVADWLRRR